MGKCDRAARQSGFGLWRKWQWLIGRKKQIRVSSMFVKKKKKTPTKKTIKIFKKEREKKRIRGHC